MCSSHGPIANSRPDYNHLLEQATFVNAVDGQNPNPEFSFAPSFKILGNELNFWRGRVESLEFGPGTAHAVNNGSLDLIEGTAMLYKVPRNTTLVEVIGQGGGMCYASLSPQPSWWFNGTFPDCYRGNKTASMFLLPVDPTIEYTLTVGDVLYGGYCRISGIRNYPFH